MAKAKKTKKKKTLAKKSVKSKGPAKSKLKAKVKSKPKAKAKPTAKPKAKSKAKVKAKTKTKTKVVAKAKPRVTAKPSNALLPPKRIAPKNSESFVGFITPLGNRLLVRISEMERKTPGGLFIPDTVGDVSGNLEGQVVASGRGHRDNKGRLRPMDVRVGDRVVFSQYAGEKMELRGEELIILREDDVLGVVVKS